MPIIIEQILQVIGALIVGAAIGYEREIKNKPAGFFTFTLVCVGSCLIAILQKNIVNDASEQILANPLLADVLKVDQGRIVAQVVSGIGFLGAGTIIHNRGNVKGITTAAMLWLVSGLGLMIGTGGVNNYIIAAVTAAIILPISFVTRKLGDNLARHRKVRRIRVIFKDAFEKQLFDNLASQGAVIRKTYLLNKSVQDNVHLKESIIYFSIATNRTFEDVLNQISMQDYVIEISEA
ncbi:MAG TPA: MgtC/SapB family protein [Bacilli bacterium]|jgi:putative Mg2+ transporter-C (MgtC) family protein|nr:MgtC/SapB family protein [Bacilli bacterium]HOR18133.1 MgtC/SapB family protein [Bacilli bacterium]HPL55772.1 MgtC/SapB family protein [Bacilli bacterium]